MLTENYKKQLNNRSPPKLPIQFSCIEYKHGKWEPLQLKTLECLKYFSICFKECLTLLDIETLKILLPTRQCALNIGHYAINKRNGRNGN